MMLANPEPMFDPNPLGDHHASQVAPNCYPLQPSYPMQCQDNAFAWGFAQKREIAPRTASMAASDTKETETAKSPTAIQIDNQAGKRGIRPKVVDAHSLRPVRNIEIAVHGAVLTALERSGVAVPAPTRRQSLAWSKRQVPWGKVANLPVSSTAAQRLVGNREPRTQGADLTSSGVALPTCQLVPPNDLPSHARSSWQSGGRASSAAKVKCG